MKFQIEDYEYMEYIAEPAFSAESRLIAWSERKFQADPDRKLAACRDGHYVQKINIGTVQSDGKICRIQELCMTPGADETDVARTYAPAFSPDGKALAFLAEDSGGRTSLWMAETDHNAAKHIRNARKLCGDAVRFSWSPDSKEILWTGRRELPGEEIPKTWTAPVVAENGQKLRSEADHGYKKQYQYTVKRLSLTCEEDSGVQDLHAGGSSKNSCLKESPDDPGSVLWAEDGSVFMDSKVPGRVLHAGKDLVIAAAYPEPSIPISSLWAYDRETAKKLDIPQEGDLPDEIFPMISNSSSPFAESDCEACPLEAEPDGSKCILALTGAEKGNVAVYTAAVSREKIVWRRITDGSGCYSAICSGEEGFLYGVRSDISTPGQLVRIRLSDGAWDTAVPSNAWIKSRDTARPQRFSFPSLDGTVTLDGWTLIPAGQGESAAEAAAQKASGAEVPAQGESGAEVSGPSAAAQKLPGVLLVHGGPQMAYADSFCMEAQLLASQGFAVIMPNPRGSSDYGKKFCDYEAAFDGTAASDLLYYMDRVIEETGCIDRDHLAVDGGSYGGYMAAWLAGHSERFRCAVAARGLLSFQYLALTSQHGGTPGMLAEPKDFEDLMLKLVKDSPNTYADRVHIPTLILHGESDVNTPLDGAHQFFVGVKDTHPDLPLRMVLFPDSGHNMRAGILPYLERYEEEMIRWIRRYI